MSILKLSKIINTKASAARKFQAEAWSRMFCCVKCGSIKAWKHRKLKNGLQKYRCEDCKHVFSDQSWTLLRWNKADIGKVAVVNHLSTSNMDIRSIARESELNKNTVYILKKKLRKFRAGMHRRFAPRQLEGIVEMDETMMSKAWFWGAVERGKGRMVVERVPNRSESILTGKVWKYVKEGSDVFTDEWAGYQLNTRYYGHFTVNHSKEFVNLECRTIHTNRIEGLWAQLKRKFDRFSNGVRLNHIQDYIDEYFYLKNHAQNPKPSFFPFCSRRF